MRKIFKCRAWDGGFKNVAAEKMELRVASYGIILRGNKLLVIKQGDNGLFSFPGGGLNASETISEGLHREVKEETGINISIKDLFCFKEDLFYYNPLKQAIHGILLYFNCKANDYKLSSINNEVETETPLWIDLAQLKKDDFFGINGEVFEQIKSSHEK